MQTLRIAMIQNEFQKAGFQWQEHIFNDDLVNFGNCMIELTQDKSPHAFSSFPRPKDTVGWGRFSRIQCWEMAYEWLNNTRSTIEWFKERAEQLAIECNHDPFLNRFESVGGNYI